VIEYYCLTSLGDLDGQAETTFNVQIATSCESSCKHFVRRMTVIGEQSLLVQTPVPQRDVTVHIPSTARNGYTNCLGGRAARVQEYLSTLLRFGIWEDFRHAGVDAMIIKFLA